ncbi:MAG: DUF3127 domain-containing protein [Clostridia bacterium]|nr:DUF3127 domain-containing protein [Clostridia bacterium]
MIFEIKNCKILEVTDVTSGTSQSGKDWRKATVIVEQADGNYTETYAIQAFDDKIDVVNNHVGETVDIKFTVKARQYNGRWYNDLRFQYVTVQQAEKTEQAKRPDPRPAPAPAPAVEDNPDNDLPF